MNYLIAGLGNIGSEYAMTRHNMGFMALDALAEASNAVFSVKRYGAIAEFRLKNNIVTLLKPSTYMNLSGEAVRYWLKELNIPLENLLVVVDDFALEFGTLRMRKKGSTGGHNGLESIDYCLASNEYARLRIGIGNGFLPGGQVDFVLSELLLEEKRALPQLLERTTAAIRQYVLEGVDRAMNQCNAKSAQMPSPLQSPSKESDDSHKVV
ncbi:MAG: aminoacyl-tRNA hydrolase [Bacteroidales bacterium]|jgi:PTH1 family peptidyl-tRNA hydrolase|nr:aminoacyl-tRNA hydrolase [Bacteroidales bacterium]MBR5671218.1 aminoacyl-tRNA hydrolase [Bacteroidales bacterium]